MMRVARATGKTTSIRKICKKFGLSSKTLYQLFPGHKAQMCAAAGVPLDIDSLKQVAKANQALKAKLEKEFLENEGLNILRRKEEEIAKEVERMKKENELRERIRRLYIEKAKVSGAKDIFSDPQKMLDFLLHTLKNNGRMLNDVDIWDSFNDNCVKNKLDVAETLHKIVGPLRDYKVEMAETKGVDLDDYIQERLEDFLIERESEETQRAMPKKFKRESYATSDAKNANEI